MRNKKNRGGGGGEQPTCLYNPNHGAPITPTPTRQAQKNASHFPLFLIDSDDDTGVSLLFSPLLHACVRATGREAERATWQGKRRVLARLCSLLARARMRASQEVGEEAVLRHLVVADLRQV